MRYLLISCFLHLIVFLGMSFSLPPNPMEYPEDKTSIAIEFFPLPKTQTEDPPPFKTTRPDVSQTKTKQLSSIIKKKLTSTKALSFRNNPNSPSQKSKQARLNYVQQLNIYIEKHKHYPRIALRLKQSGNIKVRLKITPDGQFHSIELAQSSPHKTLNHAALHLLKELRRFKPLPKELLTRQNFIIPINYQISGGIY